MISSNPIKLSELLAPSFRPAHKALMDGTHHQLVLKGGRGSCKSSYASVEVVYQLLRHPEIHAVVMRKVGNTLRSTVYAQYMWAVAELGLYSQFKFTTNPMEMTYKKTGQRIMFFGADDPGKLKSLKVPFGYVGVLHFEELDQFSGEEEIRNIEQSVMRGGPIAIEIKSFNPPRTIMNWANKYCLRDKPDQLILHSDYTTVPEAWLGQRFISDAEYLKQTNYPAYEHEYLGMANGTGGNVFANVKPLDMYKVNPETGRKLIDTFDRHYNGIDWGYYPDPFAFNRCHFDAARRDLYIFEELTLYKHGNREAADKVIATGVGQEKITCDSAEPKSVGDFRSYGLTASGAQKGPGSVEYSMKWLASLNNIYIDPNKCPDTWQEFTEYEYERDKDNNIISGYPDANNHHIDATRYALESFWKRRGQ